MAQLASHQAGLCAVREKVTLKDFLVEGKVARMLASQEPYWAPGEKSGYHAQTVGFLIGELVKRVSGRTLGEFFRAGGRRGLLRERFRFGGGSGGFVRGLEVAIHKIRLVELGRHRRKLSPSREPVKR